MLPTLIRPGVMGDIAFIASSFVGSMASGEHGASAIASGMTRADLQSRLREALAQMIPGYQISVACDPEAHDVVYGWIAHRDGVVLYLYVRKDARRNRIATRLLNHAGFDGLDGRGNLVTAVFVRIQACRWLTAAGWRIRHSPLTALPALPVDIDKAA